MSKVYFTESQRIDQLWLKLLMATVAIISFVPFLLMPNQDLWKIETMMIIMGLLFALTFACIITFVVKFETRITSDGVYYKYPPMVWKWKKVAYEELEDYRFRRYNAFTEFGGLGYKKKLFKKYHAIILKGDKGLELIFKNGKKLLLGTQKPDAMRLALKKARGDEPEL